MLFHTFSMHPSIVCTPIHLPCKYYCGRDLVLLSSSFHTVIHSLTHTMPTGRLFTYTSTVHVSAQHSKLMRKDSSEEYIAKTSEYVFDISEKSSSEQNIAKTSKYVFSISELIFHCFRLLLYFKKFQLSLIWDLGLYYDSYSWCDMEHFMIGAHDGLAHFFSKCTNFHI